MNIRRRPKRTLLSVLLAVALGLAPAARPATAEPEHNTATVSVDFGSLDGQLPRSERYNNFGNVTAWPEQRSGDVEFLNAEGLHGEIQRLWISSPNAPSEDNVLNQCDLETNSCDFSRLDAYLTDASNLADSVMVNLNPIDFIEGERPFEELRPMVELILRNLKETYPQVRYVEVFNEPDWNFHGIERRMGRPAGETTLEPGDLYRFYVPFYEAVHAINRNRPEADRVRVGGPSLMWMDSKWMEPFLDDFAADRNPRKRLDFISYHAYLAWDDSYQIPLLYKGDLSVVSSERATIDQWLRERRIPGKIPSFVSETGIYPGPAFDDPDPTHDYIRQAAGLATYSHLYANQDDTYMFNWCVRHRVEQRKDQLVTRTPDGPIVDTFTPYGNMLLMQSMMKDTRVSAESDAPLVDGDNGVYAMASKDRSGATVMVWNWQHVHDSSFLTTLDMSRLPSDLRHGPVRQRMYRIDEETSNYFADPESADLQLVDEKVITPGKTHSQTIDLGANAIYLIVLEPA